MNSSKHLSSLVFILFLGLQLVGAPRAYAQKASKEVMHPGPFSDVSQEYGYSTAISYLKNQGIISGYADGAFHPERSANRAEFVLMIIKAVGVGRRGEHCFRDVKSEWFAPYVCAAKELGFIKGYPDGLFHPEREINLAESAAVIANAFHLTKIPNANERWYKPFVLALEKQNAIPLSIFFFDEYIERGQLAEMLWRVLTKTTRKKSMTYRRMIQREKAIEKWMQWEEASKEENIYSPNIWILYPDYTVPFSSIGEYLLDQYYFLTGLVAQAEIEENNITFDPKELTRGLPDGIDSETALEIKALASIFNVNYAAEVGEKVLNEQKMLFLKAYKNIVYITIPFKPMFYMYPGVDVKTVSFIGISSGGFSSMGVGEILFVKDKNFLYKFGEDFLLTRLDAIDASTFHRLNMDDSHSTAYMYASSVSGVEAAVFVDKNRVYYIKNRELHIINDADPSSFAYRGSGIFADNDDVFFFNDEKEFTKVVSADPVTFGIHSDNEKDIYDHPYPYYRDKNHVYHFVLKDETVIDWKSRRVLAIEATKNIDINNNEIVFSSIYRQNGELYYFSNIDAEPVRVEGADIDSFRPIEGSANMLFADNKRVYFYHPSDLRLSDVEGIDPSALRLLWAVTWDYYPGDILVFRDKDIVYAVTQYYILKQLTGVDAASFEIIANRKMLLAKDKKNIFTINEGILEGVPNADVKTFEIIQDLNALIAKDKTRVYVADFKKGYLLPFERMDAATIEIVGYVEGSGAYPVIRDKNRVFIFTGNIFKEVRGADSATFVSILKGYGSFFKDKNNVWAYKGDFGLEKIEGADPKTFDVE